MAMDKDYKNLEATLTRLRERNHELLKLDQVKSEFVATAAHELRNPLFISKVAIDQLLDGTENDITDQQRKLLVTSHNSLVRLNCLVNDLLDVAKIECGAIILRQEHIDLTALVHEIADTFDVALKEKDITLIEFLPDQPLFVYLDRDKMIQVLTNLMSNACKFTPEGGTIEVGLHKKEDDVVGYVKNSGTGMARENLARLFKRFQHFDTDDEMNEKGSGLGLAIINKLIEMHKGEIWVKTEKQEGATFYFSLPMRVTEKKNVDRYFDTLINDARNLEEPLTFLICLINNGHQLKRRFGEERFCSALNELVNMIEKINLRTKDKTFLYDQRTVYVLLPETDDQGALAVMNRIKDAVSICHFGDPNDPIEFELKIGKAVFPCDAYDRRDLIRYALESLTSAQEDVELVKKREQFLGRD